jgi:O-antigen/teichoic acid export membrane protein
LSSRAQSNTHAIARNSFWYGIETGFLFVSTLFTSIAMARVLGPQKLGYFNYVMWLANTGGLLGSMGIPSATGKYIAEYLGKDDLPVVRALFEMTVRMQLIIASVLVFIGVALVWALGDPTYRVVSSIQILSMIPAMLTFVPAQTNAARENLRANAIASLVGNSIYVIAVALSLFLGWGLLGIALGILIYRMAEFLVRYLPVRQWAKSLPEGELPPEVRARLVRFSKNSVVLLLINVVVWDRSDVLLLKLLSSNIAQITFFTVSFNLVEKALILPQTLAVGVSVTINAQYGRDRSRLNVIVRSSGRYLVLASLPILAGLAMMSEPLVRAAYGSQYVPAIPVLMLAALLAIPKPLLSPAQQMLQANEQQRFLIVWGLGCGVVNIVVDALLIPHYGALGAATGNGVAQLLGVIGPWYELQRRFGLRLDYKGITRIVGAGVLMGLTIVAVRSTLPPIASTLVGIPLAALTFAFGVRLFRALAPEDVGRLTHLIERVPLRARAVSVRVLGLLSGPPIVHDTAGTV